MHHFVFPSYIAWLHTRALLSLNKDTNLPDWNGSSRWTSDKEHHKYKCIFNCVNIEFCLPATTLAQSPNTSKILRPTSDLHYLPHVKTAHGGPKVLPWYLRTIEAGKPIFGVKTSKLEGRNMKPVSKTPKPFESRNSWLKRFSPVFPSTKTAVSPLRFSCRVFFWGVFKQIDLKLEVYMEWTLWSASYCYLLVSKLIKTFA